MSDKLGMCDKRQYEHNGPHQLIPALGQNIPPFPCVNWHAVVVVEPIQTAPAPQDDKDSRESSDNGGLTSNDNPYVPGKPIEPGQAATPEFEKVLDYHRAAKERDKATYYPAPTPEAGSQLEQARTLLRRTIPFVTCIDGCDCDGCKLTTEIKAFLSPPRPEESGTIHD